MVGASISEVRGSFLPNRCSIWANRSTARSDVPPRSKIVILNSHRLEPQQFGPDFGQLDLDLGARRRRWLGPARGGLAGDPSGLLIASRTCSGRDSSVAIRSNRRDFVGPVAAVSLRHRSPRPCPPPPSRRHASVAPWAVGDGRGRLRRDLVSPAPVDLPAVGRSHPLEKISRRLILLGGDQGRGDQRHLPAAGDLAELAQHPVLDASAEHATAQQECVDLEHRRPDHSKIMTPTRP